MKVLFVCNQGKHRSKTAEDLFSDRFETKSAGLFNETPLSSEELSWADVIVVMEEFQQSEIGKRFPDMYLRKKILNWEVPDAYRYMQPELVSLLQLKVSEL